MARPTHAQIAAQVLASHGRTFASEASIRLPRNTPAPLFQLLCLAMLSSAPISAELAMRGTKALLDAGLTTPAKMRDATWEHRTGVLNESGYARYDESTSRYLADTADLLLDRYDGDLRKLRDEPGDDGAVDIAALQDRLTECKGIGDVGAQLFLREVQAVWEVVDPFMDDRSRSAAARLGLPDDTDGLRPLADDAAQFARLVAGLVRIEMADAHDQVLDAAA